ncbi:hypothetical protein A3770_09p55520 [Chloropicon primus]|uniref:Uncharacterized protein n=1 Tax=Chloropicon primus TaxID=1764295 RepID=A0A5B8MTG7_9CHLO|nr:hypothetical protein A3770_09p55520 [Chloropicon primus]|eukprot:QDZ23034.1 hypothetical protein A3770_09p55520 [Chloropicon primus]
MEERNLKLRDENLCLKKTVREQELQLKKLQTKLIRTEAAARKAVRKVGSGGFSSNAATDLQSKLLQTELRVGELEEKNEQLHQKAEREKQRVLHFQKLVKEYKSKTDSSAKLRHFRNTVVKGGGAASRSLRDSQEIKSAVRAAAKKVEASSKGDSAQGHSVFQYVDVEGTEFVMHSETLKLYQLSQGSLKPHGFLVDGQYHKAVPSRDLLLALDQYLKSHRKRLIELYEELDNRQKGVIPLERIVTLVSNVLGDPSEAELDYFRACLDVLGKGKVSYADMMSALRDVTATSQQSDGGGLRFASVSDKVLNVLLFRKQEARKTFKKQCDENGHLSYKAVSKYLRTLVPTLSSSDVRVCLSKIKTQDVQGHGQTMFLDVLVTFGVINKDKLPKKPKQEPLERSLSVIQKNLGLTDAPSSFQLGMPDLPSDKQFSEIAVARRQIDRLENRYGDSQRMVEDMKAAQKRLVDQLEETNKKLAEERKHCMMLEVEQKKLVFDIQGARDLKPLLEQAQKDILELEKENHQLMSSAIKAPQAALNELKNARWDAIEHQKQRNAAELRETELRRELASMKKQLSTAGSYSGADMLSVRVERDNAVKEVAKVKIELEAANEKLKVYQALKNDEAKQQLDPTDPIESAMMSVTMTGSEKEMSYELKHLQEAYAKQTLELEKLNLVLRHEEQRCTNLIAENESLKNQLDSAKASYDKRLGAYQGELTMKQERISKLEAKLCFSSEGVDPSQKLKNEEDMLQDIELKENEDLLILSMHSVSYIENTGFDASTSTFLVVDFYEHEPQTSDVVQGLKPRLDTSFQFVVAVDNFFISYMNSRNVVVEVNRVSGLDYQVVGAAEIPLRQMLSDKYSGNLRACDVFGNGGKLLGKLFYSIEFQNNLVRELKVDSSLPELDSDDHGYMTTGIEILIESCAGLALPDTKGEDIVAYFNYKLLDFPEHDTVFGTGKDPVFKDKNLLKAKWSPELRDALHSSDLELKCFHDSETLEGSFIGECKIAIKDLADGIPIDSVYPLHSRSGQEVGKVKVHVQWVDRMASQRDSPFPPQLEPEPEVTEESETVAEKQTENYTVLSEMVKLEAAQLPAPIVQEGENADDPAPEEPQEVEIVHESEIAAEIEEDDKEEEGGDAEEIEIHDAAEEHDDGLSSQVPEEKSSFVGLEHANLKLPDLTSNIVIHVSKVVLSEDMMENSAVEQLCVVFDFMTTFVDAKSQCTPMRPKISKVVDFSHTQVFCIDSETHQDIREHLLTLIADGNEVESSIPFCLVAEGKGGAGQGESDSKFQDIAYCEVSLMDIFKDMKDLSEAEITMLTPEGNVAATLYLSLFAVGALESLL